MCYFIALASCMSNNHVTKLYVLWVLSFKRSGKFGYFPKIVTAMILDDCFQPCCLAECPKG